MKIVTHTGYYTLKQKWQELHNLKQFAESDKLREDFEYYWQENFTPELEQSSPMRPALWFKKYKKRLLEDNPSLTSEIVESVERQSIYLFSRTGQFIALK